MTALAGGLIRQPVPLAPAIDKGLPLPKIVNQAYLSINLGLQHADSR